MANEVELKKIAKPVFGITYERYLQLAREEVVPKPERGKIDFVQGAKALIEYYRRLAESHGTLSYTDEKKELTVIKKEREKLKLEMEKGFLIPKDQQYLWLSEIISEAKQSFLNLPKRNAPVYATMTDEKEIEQYERNEIFSILNEMAKPLDGRKKKKGRPRKEI